MRKPVLTRLWETGNLCGAGGMETGTATEKNSASSSKATPRGPTQPSNSTPRCLPKAKESMLTPNVQPNVHSSTAHESQKCAPPRHAPVESGGTHAQDRAGVSREAGAARQRRPESAAPRERGQAPKASTGRHVHEVSRTGNPRGGTEGLWGDHA